MSNTPRSGRQQPGYGAALVRALPRIVFAAVLVGFTTFVASLVLRPLPQVARVARPSTNQSQLWRLYTEGQWAELLEAVLPEEIEVDRVPDSFTLRFAGWAADELAAAAEDDASRKAFAEVADDAWQRIIEINEPPSDREESPYDGAYRQYWRAFGVQGLGRADEARALWESAMLGFEAAEIPRRRDASRYSLLAHASAAAGHTDEAFRAMAASIAIGGRGAGSLLTVHPVFKDLLEETRARDLVRLRDDGLERFCRRLLTAGEPETIVALTDAVLSYAADNDAAYYRGLALEALGADEKTRRAAWQYLYDLVATETEFFDQTVADGVDIPRPTTDSGFDATFYFAGWATRGLGDIERSQELFVRSMGELLAIDPPDRDEIQWYNIACGYALSGQLEAALDAIERALPGSDPTWTRVDPDLEPLRRDPELGPRFERLIRAAELTSVG